MMKKRPNYRRWDNRRLISPQVLWLQVSQGGFTLLELMVVLVIGGILSAIALPSFFNYTLKARETEARLYVSAANKDQQRYFMENSQFSTTLIGLGLGIPTVTEHYTYTSMIASDAVTGNDVALTEAKRRPGKRLKSFSGQVWYGVTSNNLLTTSILCEGETGADPPSISNNQCQ